MAATVPGSSTIGISAEKKRGFKRVLGLTPEQNDEELNAIFRADSLNRFYIPAVMQGQETQPRPAPRTVHILGSDPRAKYLSHALHGVYDQVKPITPFATQYANIYENHILLPNACMEEETKRREKELLGESDGGGHISNLVVAGAPAQAVGLLKSVQHRVDERTAVCYMQDGLGIVEAVNNNVFTDEKSRPSATVLGHMTHAFAKDRKRDAIRSVKDGEAIFTTARPFFAGQARQDKDEEFLVRATESRQQTETMLAGFAQARLLHARGTSLDNWLLRKIPALMFASVADPLCVMLNSRYKELVYNPTAHRLIDNLLNEIGDVVAQIPEVQRLGSYLQKLVTGDAMKKQILSQLRGKKDAPCEMASQIKGGHLTNIDYLNGYFLRRAKRMGLRMPCNQMLVELVKAKHKDLYEKRRWSNVPMETTSKRKW